jgi:hypothetical protein
VKSAYAKPAESDDVVKCLTLWFNSSLGILLMLAHREDTEGAWVGLKKPHWLALPVLYPMSLTSAQRKQLVATYDKHSLSELQPIPQLNSDPVRLALDTAICGCLGLGDLGPIREALTREPVVSLHGLSWEASRIVST